MHRGGVKRPQKITAALRLKVNQNELECGVRAGGPLQLPAPQRGPRGRGWHGLCQRLGLGLEGWEELADEEGISGSGEVWANEWK